MPFAKRLIPHQFSADDFDEAWALGWFRMRQTLFTTHFLQFDRRTFAALWLRVGLARFVPDKKFLALKKLNRGFRAEFGPADPAAVNPGHEALYQDYRRSLSFEPAPSLKDLQFGDVVESMFPTWQVELFDGNTLIAGGYFDIGNRAAAGITSFYDPVYQRHSLGKYLIYLKMEFCQNRGLDYFYPGYLAPGERRFDYKRHMAAATLEYWELASGEWCSYPADNNVSNPLAQMVDRLTDLRAALEAEGLVSNLRRYLHVDINLNPQLQGMNLFDFPVFLHGFEAGALPGLFVVFHPPSASYHVLICQSVYRLASEANDEDVFDSDLLAVARLLFSSVELAEIVACLKAFIVKGRVGNVPMPPG